MASKIKKEFNWKLIETGLQFAPASNDFKTSNDSKQGFIGKHYFFQ